MHQLKSGRSASVFFLKLFFLAIPLLPATAVFFYYDPYMILHSYKRFDQSKVRLFEAHVGWQNYLQNRDSIPYDSFILGNSCTMAFKTQSWERYLDQESCAVRFFDNAETIGGVFQKIQALDSVGAYLKNILVIIDRNSLTDTSPLKSTYHLFSPETAGLSKPIFYLRFFQEFLYTGHFLSYIEYRITGKYRSGMKKVIYAGAPLREPYTNNFINPREREIELKGNRYWSEHQEEFAVDRTGAGEEDPPVLSGRQLNLLHRMKQICDNHRTVVKIIIGPNYYQKRIHHHDVELMKQLFGQEAVWDFTGINEYTNNDYNYYEPGHYRPIAGEQILQQIYHSSNNS